MNKTIIIPFGQRLPKAGEIIQVEETNGTLYPMQIIEVKNTHEVPYEQATYLYAQFRRFSPIQKKEEKVSA